MVSMPSFLFSAKSFVLSRCSSFAAKSFVLSRCSNFRINYLSILPPYGRLLLTVGGKDQYQTPLTPSLMLRTPRSNLARRRVAMLTPSR